MALWVVGSYSLSDKTVTYWIGSETSRPLPRLKRFDKADVTMLEYAYETVGAEPAAPRFWTALTAILGGTFLVLAAMIPGQGPRGFRQMIWLMLGIGLVLIGLDERFQAHEWFSRLVTKPSDITDEISWLGHDVALVIYPLVGLSCWWVLRPTMDEDQFSEQCLVAAMVFGTLSVLLDVVIVDSLRKFPMRIYMDFVEELAEFLAVALLTIVAWRRFVDGVSRLARNDL